VKAFAGILFCGLGMAAAGVATADPRLDEKVYTPYVENGVAEVETRVGGEVGGALGGETTTVVEAEYGLNDRVSLAFVGALGRAPGDAARLNSFGLEAVAYVGQIPALGVDTGLYLEYGRGLHGETDTLEAKMLFAKTKGRFQALANLIVEKPVTAPQGEAIATYGYAASVTWRVIGRLRLGAEAFGDLGSDRAFLGRQGAYVGPEARWAARPRGSPVEIEVDAGWLASAGTDRDEARSQLRLAVELERRF
jgi:hypothetical protein